MPIRVLTWNLWWRFGPWEERQVAILDTLKRVDADVICLQEVWAAETGEDQVTQLADALGYAYARTPAPFWEGMSFGNAVLSRWPILDANSRPLHDEEGKPTHRTALHASIDAPFGACNVISTHVEYRFDRTATRLAQIDDLAELVANVRGNPDDTFPVIVGGDFNALPDGDEMRRLLGRAKPHVPGLIFHDAWELVGDQSPGYTWARGNPHLGDSTWPNRRLDYLLVSWPRPKAMGRPLSCRIVGNEPVNGVMPSDHYGVIAEFSTPT
jgi:endonuclease/exonuclease/phosphatase family metal-dependent hydrolase